MARIQIFAPLGVLLLTVYLAGTSAQDAKCGNPEIKPDLFELKIIGGQEAKPGSWPWHVGLLQSPFGSHFCAGALIDPTTVITAAHCLGMSPSRVKVHLGSHLRSSRDDGEVSKDVEHFCSHPLYGTKRGNVYDIGIIRLSTPVEYSPTISPVCLPPLNDTVRTDDSLYVTGWGYTSSGWDRKPAEQLKQARQKHLSKQDCEKMRSMDVSTVICTAHDFGSSCHGDSGGPLVLQRNDIWQLQGVVSGGPPVCGMKDWPMYYTEVSKYIDWIQDYKKSASPLKDKMICREAR